MSKNTETNNQTSDVKQVKSASAQKNDGKKRISIAVQGGGAHGAFSWGVLDRLLEQDDLVIEGLSGTSAGGMNAICVAQGITEGGNQRARSLLKEYWNLISEKGKASIFKPGILDRLQGKYTMHHSPGFVMFDFLSKLFSPYQLNPLGVDPLKEVVEKLFNFDVLKREDAVKVFLAATHVYTGKLKIFANKDLKTEAVLATACLPTIHAAVMVDGEYYWDGGFIGNPAVFPLIDNCETADIMLLKLNPTHRCKLPTTAVEIGDRLNEITNNTSILREMRAVRFITKLIDDGLIPPNTLKRLHIHMIEDEIAFQDLGWSSKLNTDPSFFEHLFTAGRKAADTWIQKNYDRIGHESTFDLDEDFV